MPQPDCSQETQADLKLSCVTKDDLELLILLSQLFKSWNDRDVLAQPGLQSARILLMGASSAHSGSRKCLQASAEFKTTQFHGRVAMAGNKAPRPESHTGFPHHDNAYGLSHRSRRTKMRL